MPTTTPHADQLMGRLYISSSVTVPFSFTSHQLPDLVELPTQTQASDTATRRFKSTVQLGGVTKSSSLVKQSPERDHLEWEIYIVLCACGLG